MHDPCSDFEVMLSGLLDGELGPEERTALMAHIDGCARCRAEFEALRRLTVGTAKALAVPAPPEERWEHFLDDVYNRTERRVGWGILVVGAVLLGVYGIVLFFTEPWAGALTKLLIAAPVAGLAVLFISVLRERLRALKHDRYSREVHR